MKKASISKIKAEFSRFVKMAQRGEDVLILDRDHPVALLTGLRELKDFCLIEPTGDPKVFFRSLKSHQFKTSTDILEVLDEERSERF